jgi:hypothetical protein
MQKTEFDIIDRCLNTGLIGAPMASPHSRMMCSMSEMSLNHETEEIFKSYINEDQLM